LETSNRSANILRAGNTVEMGRRLGKLRTLRRDTTKEEHTWCNKWMGTAKDNTAMHSDAQRSTAMHNDA
jgi:hypothetical protein